MMKFTDKQSYLAARAAWKLSYKKISQDIRDAKQAYREAAREFSKYPPYHIESTKEYWTAESKLNDARQARLFLRQQARNALYELQLAKKEAARQRLTSVMV